MSISYAIALRWICAPGHHWWQVNIGSGNDLVPNRWHAIHDDVITWKHFLHYWPFVRGIHRWPVDSPHKGQWHGALIFSLICTWTNGWASNQDASDYKCHRAHYDVAVMLHEAMMAQFINTHTHRYMHHRASMSHYRQVSNIRQLNCWSLRCSWSIACRRCSNYIFILDLTPGFNGLGKDDWKTRWESFKFWDLVHLILEILRYISKLFA